MSDPEALRRWQGELDARGFTVAALNAWGNPLHPDRELAQRHDRDLRETIRLAARLGVDRVVALAGCPPGAARRPTPHFAAGGWLPYLEGIYEAQWERAVAPYWSAMSEFAAREHPGVLICIELHPGTPVVQRRDVPAPGCVGAQPRREHRSEPFLLAADGHWGRGRSAA